MRTKRPRLLLILLTLFPSLPAWCGRTAAQEIRHSLLIAGPNFTGILGEDEKIVWDSNRPGARDGFALPNEHLLIVWSNEVLEIDPASRLIHFRYELSKENQELGTAQRLANGRTLVSELGNKPRLLELDETGKVLHECPLQPETDNAHMQTRMVRQLSNGNYLVPHLLAFQVKEYTPQGNVIRSIPTDLESLGGRAAENWPFTAIRLANGNTLVTLTHGNKVVEFDAAGEVVWHVSNQDLNDPLFQDPCGAHRLPNGNTVICSYGAQQGVKIFELTPDKQVVWKYDGPYKAHEVQVLTTNGERLPLPPLK